MKKIKSKTCKFIIFRLILKLRVGLKFTTLREGKAMVKINAYSLHFLICLIISVIISQDCAAQGGVVTMQPPVKEIKQQPTSWWNSLTNVLMTEARRFHESQAIGAEAASRAFEPSEKIVIKEDVNKHNGNKHTGSNSGNSQKEKLSSSPSTSSASTSSYEFSDEEESDDSSESAAGSPLSSSLLAIENKKNEKAKKD